MSRRSIHRGLTIFGLCVFLLSTSCGEDEEPTTGQSRLGEACQDNLDCARDLLCLATQMRCVRTCEPDGEDCGEGIACQAAGDLGFCPLPPQ